MKGPLDQTAVMSRDFQELLEEYPDCKYLVILPESSVAMVADQVEVHARKVEVFIGDKMIACFSPSLPWYMVDKRHVEIITKKERITRHIETMKAEQGFMEETMPEELKKFTDAVAKVTQGSERYGQYL